jgi:hypothetical protein
MAAAAFHDEFRSKAVEAICNVELSLYSATVGQNCQWDFTSQKGNTTVRGQYSTVPKSVGQCNPTVVGAVQFHIP